MADSNYINEIYKSDYKKDTLQRTEKMAFKDNPIVQNTLSLMSDNKQMTAFRTAVADMNTKQGKYTLEILDFDTIGAFFTQGKKVKTRVDKLLVCLIIKSGNIDFSSKEVVIPIDEYLQMTGKAITPSNIKEARKNLKEDLKVIDNMRLSFKGKGKNKEDFYNFAYIQGHGIVQGQIRVVLSDLLYNILSTQNFYFNLHPNILQGNDKLEPHRFLLGTYLSNQARQIKKGNTFTLKVKSIYEAVTSIPRYEKTNRRLNDLIIEPLEKQLDKFSEEGLLKWNYTEDLPTRFTFEEWLEKEISIIWLYDLENLYSIQESKRKTKSKMEKAKEKGKIKAIEEKAKKEELNQ